jgi:hypothetical protein
MTGAGEEGDSSEVARGEGKRGSLKTLLSRVSFHPHPSSVKHLGCHILVYGQGIRPG